VNTQYQFGVDFGQHRYGGSGVYSLNTIVVPAANYGCNVSDYSVRICFNMFVFIHRYADEYFEIHVQTFPAGAIALVQAFPTPAPAGCSLVAQVRSAEQAKAAAIMIHNDASRTALSRARILTYAGYTPGT
jgi:hypothetical protein